MSDSTSSTSLTTGATGAGGGNMLRITGLNTGLDIDAMVKKMLTADQTKIDQAKQQQQLIQWKQEAYQSIIKDVQDLQSSYFDITKSTNCLLSSGNYDNMTATSGDPTTVTANAATGAAAGTYKIQVNNIAQPAAITSTSSVNTQYAVTNIANWKTGTINFNVNGTDVTTPSPNIDLSGFTGTDASSLVSYINNEISNNTSLNGKVSASLVTEGSVNYVKFTPASGTTVKMTTSGTTEFSAAGKTLVSASSSTKLTDLGTNLNESITLNLKYNGTSKSVTLDNTQGTLTVGDLSTAIENATGGDVTGKFDDMTGEFKLQTTTTGSTSSLSIESESDNGASGTNLLNALNMSVSSKQGSDANVTITDSSGTATTLTETSNNFTVNGVSYSIAGITTSAVSISVTQDTSKLHDLVSNFITKYNNVIGEIQDKLSEKKDYDYKPLTDSQKSSMSSTDITNWETKAKQGILENDDNLQNLLDNLTNAFYSPVLDSNGQSVSTIYFGSFGDNSIGIDTSNDVTQGGKLSITDDTKFTDAITNHADEIMKLFTTTSDSTDSTTKFNQSGIFQRISQVLTDNVGIIGTSYNTATLTSYANVQDDYTISGSGGTGTLPDQIYNQQLLITDLTTRMSDDQTKYYNQFTQLETTMEQLNAQQSTISSYFS